MQAVGLHHEQMGEAAAVQNGGRCVFVFTVNTSAPMLAALDAPGVGFIISDYPHELRQVPPPPPPYFLCVVIRTLLQLK